MWDVKIRVTVNAVVTAVGFTLTMWDVKVVALSSTSYSYFVLP